MQVHDSLSGLVRSEEHTSELQSHSGISYAVFCLKKKKTNIPPSLAAVTYVKETDNLTAEILANLSRIALDRRRTALTWLFFFSSCVGVCALHAAIHSFPTRRSSD